MTVPLTSSITTEEWSLVTVQIILAMLPSLHDKHSYQNLLREGFFKIHSVAQLYTEKPFAPPPPHTHKRNPKYSPAVSIILESSQNTKIYSKPVSYPCLPLELKVEIPTSQQLSMTLGVQWTITSYREEDSESNLGLSLFITDRQLQLHETSMEVGSMTISISPNAPSNSNKCAHTFNCDLVLPASRWLPSADTVDKQ